MTRLPTPSPSVRELFGQLRADLNAPPSRLAERAKDLAALIARAEAINPHRVQREWRAYLLGHRALPQLRAQSLEQLGALQRVLPERLHALDLSAAPSPPEALALKALLHAPELRLIERLGLDGAPLSKAHIEALAHGAPFESLRELSLERCALKPSSASLIVESARFQALERLNLRANPLDSSTLESFARRGRLSSLTHLDLSEKSRIDAERSHVILTTPLAAQLVELGISRCGLRGLTNELTHYTSLQALDISSNYMNDIDLSQFMDHPNSATLRHLDLGQNSIGDQGLLLTLNATDELETLQMANTRLTERGIEYLVASAKAPQLITLDLSTTRLHAGGALLLSEGRFEALEELRLARCRAGFEGILRLLSSGALPELKRCDLSHNAPLARGVSARHPRLKPSVLWHARATRRAEESWLDLSLNGLDAERVQRLTEALQGRRFEGLRLNQNKLSGRALKPLWESDFGLNLKHLDLSAASIDAAALDVIAQCGVSWARLDLGSNAALDDSALLAITRSPWLRACGALDLSYTGVTASGLIALLDAFDGPPAALRLSASHLAPDASLRARAATLGVALHLGERAHDEAPPLSA